MFFLGFYSALALFWSYGMAAHYRLGHIGVILKHCSALVSSSMNSVQEIRVRLLQNANEIRARTDDYEVLIKITLLIHPKTLCRCTNRLPSWQFFDIISLSLQDVNPPPDTPTIKYLIFWIPKAFLYTLRKAFLHIIQGSQRVHKAQHSHKKPCEQSKSTVL